MFVIFAITGFPTIDIQMNYALLWQIPKVIKIVVHRKSSSIQAAYTGAQGFIAGQTGCITNIV
jgi:hypothetical protein